MKRYYRSVELRMYRGPLFAGVAFRDNKGRTVKINKKNYDNNW